MTTQQLCRFAFVAIKECKDPINDIRSRDLRDDVLEILGELLKHCTRQEVEGHAENEDELSALGWFYTRFV